jgi:uncharacterized protein (TIGR04255 family)
MPLPSESGDPPIVELVIGVQFAALSKLTIGHYGLFWKELGKEWINTEQAPPLDDQFETFDARRRLLPDGVGIQLTGGPLLGRFLVKNQADDRLIQIQATRFHLNWRKRNLGYPSFKTMITEFESLFSKFCSFVNDSQIGQILVNQWELTYVDAFPKGELWNSPADWYRVLPGVFGKLETPDETMLEHRAAEWSYEIVPRLGRMHVVARPGKMPDRDCDALILQTTTRGPVEKDDAGSFRAGLNRGHEFATRFLKKVASDDVLKTMEPKR